MVASIVVKIVLCLGIQKCLLLLSNTPPSCDANFMLKYTPIFDQFGRTKTSAFN